MSVIISSGNGQPYPGLQTVNAASLATMPSVATNSAPAQDQYTPTASSNKKSDKPENQSMTWLPSTLAMFASMFGGYQISKLVAKHRSQPLEDDKNETKHVTSKATSKDGANEFKRLITKHGGKTGIAAGVAGFFAFSAGISALYQQMKFGSVKSDDLKHDTFGISLL